EVLVMNNKRKTVAWKKVSEWKVNEWILVFMLFALVEVVVGIFIDVITNSRMFIAAGALLFFFSAFVGGLLNDKEIELWMKHQRSCRTCQTSRRHEQIYLPRTFVRGRSR